MTRRMLALAIALCVLAGVPTLGAAAPSLVCQFTGQPMEPVPAAQAQPHNACCAVAAVTAPDGTTRLALASPGCCDLRVAPDKPQQPAVATSSVTPFAVAWVPAAPVLFLPPLTEAAPPAPIAHETAPRGPPLRSAPSRAPPFLS